jgi:hypothetical protein
LEALVVPVLVEGVLAFPALAAQTDPVLVEAAMLLATYNPEGRRIFNRSEAERALEAAVAVRTLAAADASRAVAPVPVVVDADLTFDLSTMSF